jgi:hypothetical protein
MLAFAVRLWESILLPDADNPCILLPEKLTAFDGLFSVPPIRASSSATGFLRDLSAVLTDSQPDGLLLIPPLLAWEDLPQSVQKQHPEGMNLHDIALSIVLEKAAPGCRVAAWLPLGFFLASGHTSVRQALIAQHRPRLVLEFPWEMDAFGLVDYLPARRMHTLLFQVGQSGDGRMRFFTCPHIPNLVDVERQSVPDLPRQQAVMDDLAALLASFGRPSEYGFVLQQPPEGPVAWLPGWQRGEFQKQLADLSQIGQLRPLGDLFEVLRGFAIREQVNVLVSASNSSGGIPVIEESNLLDDNSLNYWETRHRALQTESAAYHLQPNDICVRQSLTRNGRLKAVRITPSMLPLAAHESVLILRSRPGLAVDHDLIATYLRSSRVAGLLRAQGIANRVYRDSLAEVLVPAEDEELRSALTDIRSAAAAMQGWRDEADSAAELLFGNKAAQESRWDFLVAGRTLYQRERAARQIDDLSYRLRTGLPHPLAYRWRLAETAPVSYEGYQGLLATAEIFVCFLANLALVAARAIRFHIPYLDGFVSNLSNPGVKHGTSFGDWVSVLRDFNGAKAVKQAGTFPLFEIARLLDDAGINDALQRISDERNDAAHGRGPNGAPQVALHFEQIKRDLEQFVQSLEFLTDYPLRFVTDTRIDTLTGLTAYTYQSLMGDHPLVGESRGETDTLSLEKGSLYTVDRTGRLLLLRPFLTRQQMADGRWGTFFLDKFDHTSQTCELKCLEEPLTHRDGEQYGAFQAVGLRS